MKRYLYNYQTIVDFGIPVGRHSILLRCQPCSNVFQSLEQAHLVLPPQFWLHHGKDAFGNSIVFGGMADWHSSLVYVSTGIVTVGEYRIPEHNIEPFYSVPQGLVVPTEDMLEMRIRRTTNIADDVMELCHAVYAHLEYVPHATTISTPASAVFRLRRGVCQDYAHLLIALCHQNGITARYANGFLEGIGATHAWVEFFDGYSWRGVDPTHDHMIESGYIKIAHGRDAADCPVNRGTYIGNASQTMEISVTVKEI